MHYSQDKDVNRLVGKMIRAGWSFAPGRHGKLRHPTGVGFITFSKTPSDHRCLLKIRRDIRLLERKAQSKSME
jgi:hypothetical protein